MLNCALCTSARSIAIPNCTTRYFLTRAIALLCKMNRAGSECLLQNGSIWKKPGKVVAGYWKWLVDRAD